MNSIIFLECFHHTVWFMHVSLLCSCFQKSIFILLRESRAYQVISIHTNAGDFKCSNNLNPQTSFSHAPPKLLKPRLGGNGHGHLVASTKLYLKNLVTEQNPRQREQRIEYDLDSGVRTCSTLETPRTYFAGPVLYSQVQFSIAILRIYLYEGSSSMLRLQVLLLLSGRPAAGNNLSVGSWKVDLATCLDN